MERAQMNEIVRLIPTPQSHMISEDEVSLARLQNVLEAAVFDVKWTVTAISM